jgi:tellurite resistance protein TehA-like permease
MDAMLVRLTSHFAVLDCTTKHNFLGLVPWHEYLKFQDVGGACEIQNFTLLGTHSSLLLILLAIVDDLLRLAGLFAVIYIIYAGIKYIMSQGSPDETGKALESIKNALTGLVLALIAIPLVSFLAGRFDNTPGSNTRLPGLDLSSLPNPGGIDNGNIVAVLLSVVFSIVGALALLYLVIGGYNYVTSNGEANKAAKAKNTILYALIGLAVAIAAQSIVSFVTNRFFK